MNKSFVAATALLSVSAAFAGEFKTWYGDDYQIQTGLENETKTQGYWFSYDDHEDGGESRIVWPGSIEINNSQFADALDPVIEHCGGICGTAVLSKGALTYNPFAGVGFNVVGETSLADDTPVAGDASAWGGICITYSASAAPSLELGLGDFDATIGYANPSASLAKASSFLRHRVIPWSSFTQPSWYKGTTKITGEEAAKQLVSVKFKMQASQGNYDFNICAIGPYDGFCPVCCGGGCDPDGIHSVRGPSKPKSTLWERNLGISGVNSAASVEVRNIRGQVVAKGSIDNGSTLDLSSLNVGVYMIHVIGKSVNFVDKIVLR
ncbi:T9SS type A sorting domain-containing protein [Fibrobacter succinogenes]|uniref:Por secretion system C-terminal sorting domain-containing protein n=1 Tax=Fibrobacter succinogenes TaxID=833 RepID=A0A380S5Z1_FIBSU|nr:T9SS type A sorting domain-containing protein [Fibrobacter succinogenes]PWJ35758.1 putative secreted protein (Por secretion system target) [Fibrobacter succinogenes subsp. elongatus]SUQ24413.1 Por secretion system C-terminal sorting domain-containing protein [Fibrobacter succinogenes]